MVVATAGRQSAACMPLDARPLHEPSRSRRLTKISLLVFVSCQFPASDHVPSEVDVPRVWQLAEMALSAGCFALRTATGVQ